MLKSYQGAFSWVFIFCVAVLTGSCYQLMVDSEVSRVIDSVDYFKMANGDFNVMITRRYRFIVPFLAKLVSLPLEFFVEKVWPYRVGAEWALKYAFFIVNVCIFSLTGAFIYKICRSYGTTVISALVALLAVLVSRWTEVAIAFPSTDSLYFLVIVLTLYGIKFQKVWPLVFSILIGPFAKESYIFIAPVILLFGRSIIPLGKQIVMFLISGILVFSFRFWLDHTLDVTYSKSFENAFDHLNNIVIAAKSFTTFNGIGEVFSAWGIFTFIIIVGFFGGKQERSKWMKEIDLPALYLTFSILILHAFISGMVARMSLFASPVFAVCAALILDRHRFFAKYRQWLSINEPKELVDSPYIEEKEKVLS